MSPLICVGANHQTAPLDVRERMVPGPQFTAATLARYGCAGPANGNAIHGLIILSTCNRVEFYASGGDNLSEALDELLHELYGAEFPPSASMLYTLHDAQAAEHLFRVAAGLDSQVLGEPQILGQVSEAYTLALRIGSADLLLSRLFQAAIRAGKRVRSETTISNNPASISSLAVNHAARIIGDLRRANVLVIGAGEMAELTVEAMRKRGARQITVCNRTLRRARQLADRWKATAIPFERLPERLAQADVVITSTGAPHAILTRPQVQQAMSARPGRRMLILDIAVPRDVEPQVGDLQQVWLMDLDQLDGDLAAGLEARKSAVPHAESILSEELSRFLEWMDSLEMVALIAELGKKAEQIRRRQLEIALRRMPDLSEEQRRQMEVFSKALVKKLLHDPTRYLRQNSHGHDMAMLATLVRELYGLDAPLAEKTPTPQRHPVP
jgi:glutamyl-tRNA reductase